MEWVEVTAKTVDEAKERALDQLGVDEAEAEFEVLEEPKPGLFGRVRGEARVKARIAPRAPRPKQERQRKASPRAVASVRTGNRAAVSRRTNAGRRQRNETTRTSHARSGP